MISPQFRPMVGGYERAAERLALGLSRAGLHVTVLAERRHHSWPRVERLGEVKIRRFYCVYRRHLHALTAVSGLITFLVSRGRRFAVWHVQQYGLAAAAVVLVSKLLRRPVVLKLTSSAAEGIATAGGGGLMRRPIEFLVRRVSACVAVSDETANEAARFGIPLSRITCIPNGIETSEFDVASSTERTDAKRHLGLQPSSIVTLFVGRLSAEKNPLCLVQAWQLIPEAARSSALLVIVGDGPQRSMLEDTISAHRLGKSILLMGYQHDIRRWYHAADIYVSTSEYEGLSNTMLEAMACGLPVVATAVSGTSALTRKGPAGIVVPIGDCAAVSAALYNLLRDPASRERLGANARRIIEDEFSVEQVARRTLCLYHGLVTDGHSA